MGAATSAAAVGLSAVSGLVGGMGQQAADQEQAAILQQRAEYGQMAAVETNANMVTRLNQSLGNLDAMRAAGHDSPLSPTAQSLTGTTENFANQEKSIRVGNILAQSETDQASANYLRSAGNYALLQGTLGGVAMGGRMLAQTDFPLFGT